MAKACVIESLTGWAHDLRPTPADLELAQRSLQDTLAVALAGMDQTVMRPARHLGRAGRWAVAAHILDFDDLHMPSTTHVSAVIVPVVLATGGDATTYLAGAGVMARLGSLLGWAHYERGWHATCTAGAPAAAVAASLAMGLGPEETAHAMALAIPAAGGVQRAFGSDAKSLQVGMAADAGVLAATLAADGARADLAALDEWLALVGADPAAPERADLAEPAVPDGLAIKLFPCCYAMQRPIQAVRSVRGEVDPSSLESVVVRTPAATVQPLIHHRPQTGFEAKFSLEYAVTAALLDDWPGFASFTDAAVGRRAAQAIVDLVSVEATPSGSGLLDGCCEIELRGLDGTTVGAVLDQPLGAPTRPPSSEDLRAKIRSCGDLAEQSVAEATWASAGSLLVRLTPS